MPVPRNVEELVISAENKVIRYLFFWGHRPAKDGRVTKSGFSQWYESPFVVDNVTYLTAEHYMMAEKARLFGDQQIEEKVLKCLNPGAAKALGRSVQGFDETRWVENRFPIVVRGNFAKFSQDERLRNLLLQTGDQVLVEASPVDSIWGIGLAESDPAATKPEQWKGLNLLGFALMQVRDQLRDG